MIFYSRALLGRFLSISPLRIVPSLKNVAYQPITMYDLIEALPGDDPTPDSIATVNNMDPSDDHADPASADPGDTGDDLTPDDTDPDEGLHPDALDPDDNTPDAEISEEELKEPSRLQKRMKELTSKANRADDLEQQNKELLQQLEEAQSRGANLQNKKDPNDPDPSDGDYTPEQLAQAKKLMDKLGYVPKDKLESLEKQVKKMSSQSAQQADQRMMEEAITRYQDDKGNPIVNERHIKNALRKWIQSDDPQVRKRAELDYDAIIQLIGGAKINKVKPKKKPAPKVPDSNGEPAYKPEKPKDELYNPADPIGSEAKMLSRILSTMED